MSGHPPRYVKPGFFTNRVFNPFVAWLVRRAETEWVRNIRVAGAGVLITRHGREAFAAAELQDSEKLPVIRAYLKEWAWEVGAFFEGLSARSSDSEVAAVAADFPVFRLRRDDR